MRSPRYQLTAFYRNAQNDETIDAMIKNCVRGKMEELENDDGERRLRYSFYTETASVKAAKKMSKIRGVRIEVFDVEAQELVPA